MISAASIERFLKWGAVPLALVVAFFVSRYGDDIFGTSDTGLDATARARFVDSTAPGLPCGAEQRPGQQGVFAGCHRPVLAIAMPTAIADRLSDDDLKALATMERSARARKLQPMVEAASALCLKALPKAN